jgi:hypothetical protein
MCRRLLESPQEFRYHVRKTAARIILKMTYGSQVGAGQFDFLFTYASSS